MRTVELFSLDFLLMQFEFLLVAFFSSSGYVGLQLMLVFLNYQQIKYSEPLVQVYFLKLQFAKWCSVNMSDHTVHSKQHFETDIFYYYSNTVRSSTDDQRHDEHSAKSQCSVCWSQSVRTAARI